MNILDIIILVSFIPTIIFGVKKGFVSQFITILSLILGVWASTKFADLLGDWLSRHFDVSEQTLKLVAFSVILIAVIVCLLLIGRALEAVIKFATLEWLNYVLGIVFAIFNCILVLGILSIVFEALNETFGLVNTEYIAQSALYQHVKHVADLIFPYVKEMLAAN